MNRASPRLRFWNKVNVPQAGDGCWEWSGTRKGDGYGLFWDGAKKGLAHRFAWKDVNGEVPDNMLVCHHCDNPACIRPSHLFIGTHLTNNRDMRAKGRGAVCRGAKNGQARLTQDEVESVIQSLASPYHGIRAALALEFGVSEGLIRSIERERRWALLRKTIPETVPNSKSEESNCR